MKKQKEKPYDFTSHRIFIPENVELTSLGSTWKEWSPFRPEDSEEGFTYDRTTGVLLTGGYTYTRPPDYYSYGSASIIKEADTVVIPELTPRDYEHYFKDIEGGEAVATIAKHNELSPTEDKYEVACVDARDLSPERILKTLSSMKTELMMRCAPVRVRNVECIMTPIVKQRIIQAYKRLEMYGKKTPIIPCFDEYGNRLEDKLTIDTVYGMTIKVIDPEEYGELFLSFTGIITKNTDDRSWFSEDELPF